MLTEINLCCLHLTKVLEKRSNHQNERVYSPYRTLKKKDQQIDISVHIFNLLTIQAIKYFIVFRNKLAINQIKRYM
jgi:hypothetical protein